MLLCFNVNHSHPSLLHNFPFNSTRRGSGLLVPKLLIHNIFHTQRQRNKFKFAHAFWVAWNKQKCVLVLRYFWKTIRRLFSLNVRINPKFDSSNHIHFVVLYYVDWTKMLSWQMPRLTNTTYIAKNHSWTIKINIFYLLCTPFAQQR